MNTTTDPYDEIPLPAEGVLSDKESGRQLREDSCRQYIDRIGKLEAQLESVSSSLMIASRDLHIVTSDRNGLMAINEKLRADVSNVRSKVHAAHGLLYPLGNQVTPSVMAIREALQILRGA